MISAMKVKQSAYYVIYAVLGQWESIAGQVKGQQNLRRRMTIDWLRKGGSIISLIGGSWTDFRMPLASISFVMVIQRNGKGFMMEFYGTVIEKSGRNTQNTGKF